VAAIAAIGQPTPPLTVTVFKDHRVARHRDRRAKTAFDRGIVERLQQVAKFNNWRPSSDVMRAIPSVRETPRSRAELVGQLPSGLGLGALVELGMASALLRVQERIVKFG